MTDDQMQGHADTRFAPVADLLRKYLAADAGYSCQLSIRWNGERVVDLTGGALANEAVTGVYSVTKGVSAMVVATLLERGGLQLEARVADYWPEFAASGKADVTVGQVLAHQAGIPAIERRVTVHEILDDSALAAARLAGQTPLWKPGSAFGYHALTIGILIEELVRRVTGSTLQEVFEREIRAPRSLDVYLGLPEEHDHRYVPLGEVVHTIAQRAEIDSRPPVDALSALVFDNVAASTGLDEAGITPNAIKARRAGQGAIGAVASARGLADLYAAALVSSQRPIASPSTFEQMAQQRSWGQDRVLNVVNAFGTVFMVPQPRMPFGGIRAFGHDGAGGALAFADPETQIGFGYVPHPMQYPGGADRRSVALALCARDCALALS